MKALDLYLYLDKAGIKYDVLETFEGLRTLSFEVEEETIPDYDYTEEGKAE